MRRRDRAAGRHPRFLDLGPVGERLESLAAQLNRLRQYPAPGPTLAPKLRRKLLGPAAAEMLYDIRAILERLRAGQAPPDGTLADLTRLASEHRPLVTFSRDERGLPAVRLQSEGTDSESRDCASLLSDLMVLFNNPHALGLLKRLKSCAGCGKWVVDRSVSNRRTHCGETCSERLKKRRHRDRTRRRTGRPARRRVRTREDQ